MFLQNVGTRSFYPSIPENKIDFPEKICYTEVAKKANVLTAMLANPKIAPVLAFTHCGLFSDPQLAYRMSMDYAEEQEKKAAELATKQKEVNPDGKGNPPDPGSGQED